MMLNKTPRNGMTLIELLGVCAIIAIIIVCAFQFFGTKPLPPAPPGAVVPTHFEIVQQSTFATSLDVNANGARYGTIARDGSFWTSFTYHNAQGATLANAVKSGHLWGTQVEIRDGSGRLIGTLKKQVWAGGLGTTVYSVLDAAGREVATSEKVQRGEIRFTLKSPSGRAIATLQRPSWQARDSWTVDIHVPDVVDQRILIVIAAFKTHADDSN